MNDNSKIIFIGAEMGNYKLLINNNELKNRFESDEDLKWLYYEFLESVKQGDSAKKGWKSSVASIYKTSKLFINVYAQRLGKTEKINSKGI